MQMNANATTSAVYEARSAVPNREQSAADEHEHRGPLTLAAVASKDHLLHVDANYILVSKPADVRMDGSFDVTLQKLLLQWIPDSTVASLKWVHQLDYATSGVLCVARSKKAAGLASMAFQTRETNKQYLAIVEGHLDTDSWEEMAPTSVSIATPGLSGAEAETTASPKRRVAAVAVDTNKSKRAQSTNTVQDAILEKSLSANYAALLGYCDRDRGSGGVLAPVSALESESVPASTESFVEAESERLVAIPYVEFQRNSRYRKALKKLIQRCPAMGIFVQMHQQLREEREKQKREQEQGQEQEQEQGQEQGGAVIEKKMKTEGSIPTPTVPPANAPTTMRSFKDASASTATDGTSGDAVTQPKQPQQSVFRHGTELVIDIPVAEVDGDFRCEVGHDGNRGKQALTRLRVLQYGYYKGSPVTKVLLMPHTGRRHQLRVHCRSLGHPIVGDFTYNWYHEKVEAADRMMLHAHQLTVSVPSKERKYLESARWKDVGLVNGTHTLLTAVAPDPFNIDLDA